MKVFGLTRRDDAIGFYRIIQPLRFLKRAGNDCQILPFSGQNMFSVLPVHDKLLLMLSDKADVILSTPVFLKDELLRMLNLRKHSGAKLVIDIAENLFEVDCDDTPFQSMKAADGLIVSTEQLKKLYEHINPNILVLPSGIDFTDIQSAKPCIDGDYQMIKEVTDKIKIPYKVTLLPLLDNNYNRCLDNIRLLKYCANKIVCVASKVECYKDYPLLASSNYEWYDQIEKLQDKEYKKLMAEACYKYAQKYDEKELIKGLEEWLRELPRKVLKVK